MKHEGLEEEQGDSSTESTALVPTKGVNISCLASNNGELSNRVPYRNKQALEVIVSHLFLPFVDMSQQIAHYQARKESAKKENKLMLAHQWQQVIDAATVLEEDAISGGNEEDISKVFDWVRVAQISLSAFELRLEEAQIEAQGKSLSFSSSLREEANYLQNKAICRRAMIHAYHARNRRAYAYLLQAEKCLDKARSHSGPPVMGGECEPTSGTGGIFYMYAKDAARCWVRAMEADADKNDNLREKWRLLALLYEQGPYVRRENKTAQELAAEVLAQQSQVGTEPKTKYKEFTRP